MRRLLVGAFGVLILLAGGCDCGSGGGGSDAGDDGGSDGGSDAGSDSGTVTPKGTLSALFRVDNMGWRTADRKVAVLVGHAATAVQLIDATSGAVAGSSTSSTPLQADTYSGDSFATV